MLRGPGIELLERRVAIAPAFGYELALDSPAFGGALGATHCLDLPFTFGVADRWAGAGFLADLGDPVIDRVSRLMHRAWTACLPVPVIPATRTSPGPHSRPTTGT